MLTQYIYIDEIDKLNKYYFRYLKLNFVPLYCCQQVIYIYMCIYALELDVVTNRIQLYVKVSCLNCT